MNMNDLPLKMFKKNDIVNISEKHMKSSWYKEDRFRIVSYSIMYREIGDNEIKCIIESKISTLDDSVEILRWLVNIKSLDTGKSYREYAESMFILNKQEFRNKKIKELLS